MTLREIVKEMRNRGISVTYRARNDGSIVIKSINGQKYSGKEGNFMARVITGSQETGAQVQQRQKALEKAERTKAKQRTGKLPKSLPHLTKRELKKLNKLNRHLKKTKGEGRLGRTKARQIKRKEGFSGVNRQFLSIARRNLKLMHPNSILALADLIKAQYGRGNAIMLAVASRLRQSRKWILKDYYEQIKTIIYGIEKETWKATENMNIEETSKFTKSDKYKMILNQAGQAVDRILDKNDAEISASGIKDLYK